MGADFTPERHPYTSLKPFRAWVQKTLPLVYDDSLSYYELLSKLLNYVNIAVENFNGLADDMDGLFDAYNSLQTYVNTYFDNLDVAEEINDKLDEMASSGQLSVLLQPLIPNLVTTWLNANVDPVGSAVVVDKTLSISSAAADALITGSFRNNVYNWLNNMVFNRVNLAKMATKTLSTTYTRTETRPAETEASVYNDILSPIRFEANTTYYYRNLYGYFTKILYDDESYDYLKDDEYAYASGSFTPTQGGYIYISVSKSAEGIILFTDYEYLYDAKDDGWFLPNLLKVMKSYPIIILDNTIMTDANLITDTSIYRIQLSGTAPAHLPSDITSGTWLLVSVASLSEDNRTTIQFLYNYARQAVMYIRNGYNNNSTWSDWLPIRTNNLTFYVGASEEFTTLRSGIEYARKFKGSTVVVRAGTYDLVDEFDAEIEASTARQFGILIDNGIHVIFDGGALVTAYYEGTDTNVLNNFSPFIAGPVSGGFTLENLNIRTKNTRYCVHDDTGDYDIVSVNKYINCRMVHDDTENSIKSYPQCIGGGFGRHGYVELRGCFFRGIGSDNYPNPLVSYHNCNNYDDAQSDLFMSDCYFYGQGTYRTTHLGNSEAVSLSTLCNCSFGSQPINQYEVSGAVTPENTNIFSYRCDVRN